MKKHLARLGVGLAVLGILAASVVAVFVSMALMFSFPYIAVPAFILIVAYHIGASE